MKKSNLFLIIFIAIVAGASFLNSYLLNPSENSFIRDKTFLKRSPQPNDLFILRDSNELNTFFKIKEVKPEGQNQIVYGRYKMDFGNEKLNYTYLKQLVEKDYDFDLKYVEYKTDEELRALFTDGKLESDAVFKVEKVQTPGFIKFLTSYFGYLFLTLVVFLIIWLLDVIGQLIQRIPNLPKHSRLYFFSAIGIYVYSLQIKGMFLAFEILNSAAGNYVHISWIFGLLGILPVALAFKYVKNHSHNLPFAQAEAWKFITLLVVGIASFVLAFKLCSIILGLIINDPNVSLLSFDVGSLAAQSYLMWAAIASGNFLNNFRKHFFKLRQQESKLKTAQKNELASQAELDALQARINPHFLYNSLNSIASLAQIDPPKTEAMAMTLSKFYKYSTNREEAHLSSIEEEIEMLETYLEIEKIRFGERLQFQIDYEKSDFDWQIPRFLLQPIVENAIKHGYDKSENNIKILIEVKEKPGDVSIAVFDNGMSFPENMNMGYGLRSVKKKLKLLFPEKHQLEFVNAPKKHVLIKINQ